MKTKILISIICACSLFKVQAQDGWEYVCSLTDESLRKVCTQRTDTVYVMDEMRTYIGEFHCCQTVFPTQEAIWNINIDGEAHYYGLTGDTIIDSTPYNKLYLLNDTTLNIDSRDVYVGGFRQKGKKVWFRPSFPPFYPLYDDQLYDDLSYPKETLLYDFSKNVGDTIWHNTFSGSSYWDMGESISASIITSIDNG